MGFAGSRGLAFGTGGAAGVLGARVVLGFVCVCFGAEGGCVWGLVNLHTAQSSMKRG